MPPGGPNPAPESSQGVTTVAPLLNDPWIGRKLKRYTIIAPLGKGGMGVVYLADDPTLKRVVAIKMLSNRQDSDPNAVKRFLREARSAARLQHANVASIYELDEEAGRSFLVMEYVPGPTAQQIIDQQGRLPRAATQIALEACRGLAAAHAARLIHRDIKPANILVSRSGEVKLSDFGLAKGVTDKQTVLTLGNQVVGTPHYMSPEQGQNGVVDERSDIYSLGATFYALLTGGPPFPGNDIYATVYAHISQPVPDPRAKAPDIPDACCAIVQKAMEKRRGDRHADSKAMLADLEAALGPTRESLGELAAKFDVPAPLDVIAPSLDVRRPRSGSTRPLWIILGTVVGFFAALGIAAFGLIALGLWLAAFRPGPAGQGAPPPVAVRDEDSPDQLKRDLMARNPGFDGKFKFELRERRIVKFSANADRLTVLDPLGDLAELEDFDLDATNERTSALTDIAALSRLKKLNRLRLHSCPVKDIDALKDLTALKHLDLGGTKVESLQALRNLRLTSLRIGGTLVPDLRGLENVPIEKLYAGYVYRLKKLDGLPVKTIKWLTFESTEVDSLDALQSASSLEYLNLRHAKVTRDHRPKEPKQSLSPRDLDTVLALPKLQTVVGEFTADEEARLKNRRVLRQTPNESF